MGNMQGLVSPPGINPHAFWHCPSYLTCFRSSWSEDSLILMPVVMRDRTKSEPNYRKLSLAHPRLHKSYTGAVYICVSRLAPSDILNLIFKAWFARSRGQFSPNS